MGLLKTVVVLAILVGAGMVALVMVRSTGVKAPIEQQIEAAKTIGSNAGVLAASSALTSSPTNGVIALSNDPRRATAPLAAATVVPLDPETAKRYADALENIEIDACNANGSVVVRVRGERSPHLVRNGQIVKLPHDFDVTLKLRGYPNCRVMLYDGKVEIGEVSGF